MDTIQVRVRQSPASQEQVAQEAGYPVTAFSRMLRGLRRRPDDFEDRVYAALDALECAAMAAEEAHRKVLAQHAAQRRPQRHERRKGMGESPATAAEGAAS